MTRKLPEVSETVGAFADANAAAIPMLLELPLTWFGAGLKVKV